jgi:thiamine biosynthesis protein ThiI
MERIAIIHYDEITLKGGSRHFFESRLLENIRARLKIVGVGGVRLLESRIFFEFPGDLERDVRQTLEMIFGIKNFSFGKKIKNDIESLKAAALGELKDKEFKTFKIEASRADKKYPLTSPEIDQAVAEYIFENKSGIKAQMKNPDVAVRIEVLRDGAFIYTDNFSGPGGLPSGSSGRVLALLSGGIDSPVAAWRLAKRGLDVNFIHFHSYPFTDKISTEKVKDLAAILGRWQRGGVLFLVPLADIQKEIVARCSAKLRVLLYRRMMVRIAERIARENKIGALITGESVGQVASQTLPNIGVVNDAATLPVFRPLIGYDKEEIIAEAKRIGTYEISIQPHGDCCSLFLPPHPETKARLSDIIEEEKNLDIVGLVDSAVRNLEKLEIRN